jgi:excisionase family DNA binding protein
MNRKLTQSDFESPRHDPGRHTTAAILVDAREASRLLAISPRTLWQLTKQQLVPTVRIGRSVRYRVADLDDWARKQTTGD